MTRFRRPRGILAGWLMLLAFLSAPAPVAAADIQPMLVAPIVFADSFSWHGFVRYWKSFANRTDRVVLVVALVGGSAIFIITRGKWRK